MSTTLTAPPSFIYEDYSQAVVAACPICGHANPSEPAIDRYGFPIGTSLCSCGYAYLNPLMSADGYMAFYAHGYRRLVDGWRQRQQLEPEHEQASLLDRYAAERGHMIAICAAQVCPPRRPVVAVCDVGGSTGAIAAEVITLWPATTVTIIDPNPTELAAAAARGFATVCAQADALPVLRPQDILICSQTLDHVADPLALLRWMRAHLAVGGWMYVDILDARRRALVTGLKHYEWKLDHPGYWSASVLERALRETGWRRRMSMNNQGRLHYGVWCEGA